MRCEGLEVPGGMGSGCDNGRLSSVVKLGLWVQ